MPKIFEPEQIELSNGIPVILQHLEGPVASTYWWVRTGSADEAPDEAGFAHFLEHMLFKDAAAKETGQASTGKMAQAIESLGGDINAYTSFDQTVYHVTCAAHHWERVIDAFGGMAKPQKFLKSDFEREREVILEELKKNEDSPGRQLFQSLFSATFKKHPYGKPVIGYVKILKAARVSKLESFYRRNYVSGKMGLVLVGPVGESSSPRRKEILKRIEKYFGSKVHRKTDATYRARKAEPANRPEPSFTLRPFDVKMPSLSLSLRVPDLAHPDIPALDLMASILGMGELSRLYQKLFYGSSIVTEVSGGLYVPKDAGMLYFQAEVSDMSKIIPAAEGIFREIKRIQEDGPTAEELARVLVNAESERLYSTQTADGTAGRLGFLKFIMGDLDFDQKYLEELRGVDATRIREVARQYLDCRKLSAVVMVPKDQKNFDLSEIKSLAETILKPAVVLTKGALSKNVSRPEKTGADYFRLPSGIEIVYFNRPSSHVCSVHAAVLGGLRLELAHPVVSAKSDWGSSSLLAMTWTKGTSNKDARQISTLTEGHASSIDGFSGRNTVGLQMTGLAKDWGALSPLFTEVLLDPIFPDSEIDHARRVLEDSIRGIEDHSAQLCTKLFLETLFENHPYGHLTTGSLESLVTVRHEKLKKFHQLWMRPERLVLAISGAVKRASLDLWLAEIERKAGDMARLRDSTVLPEKLKLENEPLLKGPRWVEKNLKREQAHIIVGGLGTTITADDRFALRILQTILSGQSGRLFVELREKKSLAYTVSPLGFEGIERGYLGTYIACAPQKKEEAIAGIRSVLEKLASKGPSAAEMNRAREFYLGRRAMDLQSDSALASHFSLERVYGLISLTEKEVIKKIHSITAKEVQKVCTKYFVDPPMVTAVVG